MMRVPMMMPQDAEEPRVEEAQSDDASHRRPKRTWENRVEQSHNRHDCRFW